MHEDHIAFSYRDNHTIVAMQSSHFAVMATIGYQCPRADGRSFIHQAQIPISRGSSW